MDVGALGVLGALEPPGRKGGGEDGGLREVSKEKKRQVRTEVCMRCVGR